MTKTYSIYCIRNKTNGKRYVGLAENPERRMESHCKSKYVIGKAIRKHGWENFTKRILESNLTLRQAKTAERRWIKKYNCIVPNGYNLTGGGDGLFNPSAETRAAIGRGQKGRIPSQASREKQSEVMKGNQHLLGHKPSAETRAKLSKANKGRKLSAEICVKISERLKGNQYSLGHKHSAESRAKMSKAQTGKKRSPEQNEANRQRQLGKKHSAEQNAKHSKTMKRFYRDNPDKHPMKGRKQSAESIAKSIQATIKAAAKRRGISVAAYIKQRDTNKRHSTKYNIEIGKPKLEKVLAL